MAPTTTGRETHKGKRQGGGKELVSGLPDLQNEKAGAENASSIGTLEPLTLSVKDAAKASGLSKSGIYLAMKESRLGYTKIKGRRLIPVAELRRFLFEGEGGHATAT